MITNGHRFVVKIKSEELGTFKGYVDIVIFNRRHLDSVCWWHTTIDVTLFWFGVK